MYESSICYLYLKKFVLENPSAAKVKRHTAMAIHYLCTVHLISKKINVIIIKVKTI